MEHGRMIPASEPPAYGGIAHAGFHLHSPHRLRSRRHDVSVATYRDDFVEPDVVLVARLQDDPFPLRGVRWDVHVERQLSCDLWDGIQLIENHLWINPLI